MCIQKLSYEIILKIFEHTDKDTLVNSISHVIDDEWFWKKITMKYFGDLYKAFPELLSRSYQYNWRLEFKAWFQITCGQKYRLSKDKWLKHPQTYKSISVKDLICAVKGLSRPGTASSGSCLVSVLTRVHKQCRIPTLYNMRRDLIISVKCTLIGVFLAIRDSLDLFQYFWYINSGEPFSSEFPLDEALTLTLSLTLGQKTSLVNSIRKIRQQLELPVEYYTNNQLYNESKECNHRYDMPFLEHIMLELMFAVDVSNDCEMYCKNEMYGACINAIKEIHSQLEYDCNPAVHRLLETLL